MRILSLVCVWACVAAAPAGAATLTVNAGGNLQAAIDAAQPGDVIELQPGAVFTGNYKLTAKGGTTYITIRTGGSTLPPAGTRMTPTYAPLLAKIRSNQNGPALRAGAGANYWRLQWLELSPSVSTSSANLVELGGTGTSQDTLSEVPHHLIIDRCYLHGDASYGQRRGLALNSGDTQVINSYFADFKQVLQDTQAIAGWNGPGPYLIENNYIEGAAENILFGGNDPQIQDLVPSNITIRRNYISKPLKWRSESWTIKNLIELKNAQDVLVEGNTIENNWNAGQEGYSIIFTPRNQSGTAPWSIVKNVTIQNNVIRHVAAVFNVSGYDDEGISQQTQHIIIRNNLMYDVSTSYTNSSTPGPGRLAIIGNGPKDITFDHNTVDNNGSSTIFLYAGKAPTGTQIYQFVLTNNLLRDNQYGVFGDKVGEGNVAFAAYTPGAIVLQNTFAGGDGRTYPTGNDFPPLNQWLADFVSVGNADYRLVSTSISKNVGTDGKDLGVDFATLDGAMSGTTAPSTADPTSSAGTPSPSTGSAPYGGTASALPGTVQVENYDTGGSLVAYYDTTSANSGGAYRDNNVDIEATTDTGGGYNVGWTKATEWLQYTVNVAASGTYSVDLRVASNGSGGTFHIAVDGVDKTGSLTVPNTGGWQTWKTITRTGVSLPSGIHLMRLVMDGGGATGGIGNFNWVQVRQETTASTGGTTASGTSAYGGTPATLPGTVQFENYDAGGSEVAYWDTTSGNSGGAYRTNNVDIEATRDTGGGYDVGWTKATEWLKYTVNVAASGTYSVDVRAASNGSGGTFHIEVDGVDKSGPLTVLNTGGWQVWKTITKTGVSLSSGIHVLRVVMDATGASGDVGNFNWLAVR